MKNNKPVLLHKNLKLFFVLFILTFSATAKAQEIKFTKADTLRGSLDSKLRTCYDVKFYHLDLTIDLEKQFISGSNEIWFTALSNFKSLQIDLFRDLNIDKILYNNKNLNFSREEGAVFVNFPKTLRKGVKAKFRIYYSGKPITAKNAPWDGGLIFSKDNNGNTFASVACQGIGASSWWPNKDQLADKPDSMLISINIPKGKCMNVSNGQLRSVKEINGYKQYNWFVSYPISNYNVAFNIGNYVHLKDHYQGLNGDLNLNYYVLEQNAGKAKQHFDTNVKRTLEAFEYWFGPFPFYKDGYKLVETPYLGMEHQTAIAYGNNFKNGYDGRDLSATGWGLKWDFIIVHESGHEWFGNNISCKDIADMWIHESFTTYAEGLFTEYWYGKQAGSEYIIGLRNNILNNKPMLGIYGVNNEGSTDMYYKGANMLHTLRTILNNDLKWRSILIGLNEQFRLKTVNSSDIINYINQRTGNDFTDFFDQYLKYVNIPKLEIRKENNLIFYRWNCEVKDFSMPLDVSIDGGEFQRIQATSDWQNIKGSDFKIKNDFYVNVVEI